MAATSIQWADYTFNPWEGCTKVSAGCAHCYAEARNARFGGGTAPNWGKGAPRRRTSVHNWNDPRRWNRKCQENIDAGKPFVRPRVFCASLADWLDAEVQIEWFADLLALIWATPHLDWLLLSKRPENWKDRVASAFQLVLTHRPATDENYQIVKWGENWLNGRPPAGVQIGVTMEDRDAAAARLDDFLAIPASRRFISAEPLLEEVDFAVRNWSDIPGLAVDQIIVGGESGRGARPFDVQWARLIIEDCAAAGVACFVKQLGALAYDSSKSEEDAGIFLKDAKGGDMAEWPADLRVREFSR